MEEIVIPTNEFQTPVTREWLDGFPDEVQEQFLDFVNNVPLIKYMIGTDRKRAKDLPRDDKGRIIVDITHPHILEDMDYFRPAAKFFEENGCYSLLKPNANPNSEYGKWFLEERRRCREGYVRESDGEWVTGLMYWFMNYSPIMLNRKSKTGTTIRVEGFPDFWEGIYYRYHYYDQARHSGKHCMELARRGAAKSFSLASLMAHNLILGENEEATKRVTTILTAFLKEYLSDKDGTLSKFTPMIDFVARNMEFPRLMSKRSQSEMIWTMGYKNKNGNIMGSLNQVLGLSVKDDEGKIRGKRGFILFEEMGNYSNFKGVWNNVRDSVMEGDNVFSLLIAVGTAGDKESDFAGVKTMLYNPESFGVLALDNVYDEKGKGTEKFSYFFPSYMSRADCMDKDGNSDVTKALMQILMQRFVVKMSNDSESLLSRIAQMPITPAEAILKVRSSFFPTAMLNERIRQLDQSPHIYDDVHIGTLVDVGGHIEFRMTDDVPIRTWPVDNTERGAFEVYVMPDGKSTTNRYIIGVDPVNSDKAESQSLFSFFVFDMMTDDIVAEYTGRKEYAEDGFELVRLAAIFWNAQIMYESNSKMMFSYFAKKRCTWMLADCPEYMKARGLIKYDLFGSSVKGITVNTGTIIFANQLVKEWLIKTYPVEVKDENGEFHIEQVPQLYRLRNRALLQELVSWGPEANTDRVSALHQVMMFREHFIILYGGAMGAGDDGYKDAADDDFFNKDWNRYKKMNGMD